MPRSATLSDWLVLFALTIFWGSAFLFTELALRSFPPTLLVGVRLAVALAVLLIVLLWKKERLPPLGKQWLPILIMALLSTILPFNLIAWAQSHIDSGLTGILMAVMPLFVVTLSHFFIPGERLSAMRLVGFVFGFAGVVLVVGPELEGWRAGRMEVWGMLAVLASALCYAAGSVYTRRRGHGNPIVLATGMLVISAALAASAGVTALTETHWPPAPESVVAIAVLGVICTAFSTVLFFRLVQGPGPTFLSLVNYMVPAWAVLAGALILGESVEMSALGGLALILAGLAVSEGGHRLAMRTRLKNKTADATAPGAETAPRYRAGSPSFAAGTGTAPR